MTSRLLWEPKGARWGRDNPLPLHLWGLDLRGVRIMETAFKAPHSGERGEGSVGHAASPGMPAWAPESRDVIETLCSCQAPAVQAPPGQLGTDANQKLPAQGSCHPPLSWQPAVHGGRACGFQSRAAFETISCSLKGGQRGMWCSEGQGETVALGATCPAR